MSVVSHTSLMAATTSSEKAKDTLNAPTDADTSTSKLASVAETDDADSSSTAQNTSTSSSSAGRSSSMNNLASLLSRRSKTQTKPTDSGPSVVTLHDVRKFVFQATARADKRVVGGLAAHTFTSQTFISSFAVGLAIGSVLAIIIKLLMEVGCRVLPYRS